MCNGRNEIVTHIFNDYSKLAQTKYKERHDKIVTIVLRDVCSKYGFKPAKHWYKHRAEGVMENQNAMILWDFNIRTDHVIEARLC